MRTCLCTLRTYCVGNLRENCVPCTGRYSDLSVRAGAATSSFLRLSSLRPGACLRPVARRWPSVDTIGPVHPLRAQAACSFPALTGGGLWCLSHRQRTTSPTRQPLASQQRYTASHQGGECRSCRSQRPRHGECAPGVINQSWQPSPENFPEPFPLYMGGGEFRALESPKRGKTVNFGESMQPSNKPYPTLIATQHATRYQPRNCFSGAFCLPVWCNCQAFGYAAQ